MRQESKYLLLSPCPALGPLLMPGIFQQKQQQQVFIYLFEAFCNGILERKVLYGGKKVAVSKCGDERGQCPVLRLFPDSSSPMLFLIRWGKVQVAKELWNTEV